MFKRVKYLVFLRDVAFLSFTTFGGATAHIAYFQSVLVERRRYLSDEDLLELNSLCQIIPGPTSTQTLTAIGFRIGGPSLAYLTLFIWVLPAVLLMILAAVIIPKQNDSWFRFVLPMVVGIISYSAYKISLKTVKTKLGIGIMICSAVCSYFFQTPYVFPIILISAGLLTAFKYKEHPKEEKDKLVISWSNFLLWAGVFVLAALLGHVTKALPIRLFENFYRNGSLIFGGGHALTPLLYTEFVQYAPKQYLTSEEFLSGYALAQSLPGPVFSFSSYIGALSMRGEYGLLGQLAGGIMAAAGIFLPGTFLIFFISRFWASLKKYRPVRASLEGVTAASAGLIAAAAIIMFQPLDNTVVNFGLTIATFVLLTFTKIKSPFIIIAGIIFGIIL